jgi:hypothetical protein
MMLNGNTS